MPRAVDEYSLPRILPKALAARMASALVATVVAVACLGGTAIAIAAPPKGGAANIAMIGEPQTLDPMASTADLVGTIMQHVYELLYTYDANSNVVPMLAESMPAVSKDGLVYTIALGPFASSVLISFATALPRGAISIHRCSDATTSAEVISLPL